MVGELQKTNMGWVVKYPIINETKDNSKFFNTTLLFVSNQDDITDKLLGETVKFNIDKKKFKNNTIPEVKVILN